MVETGSQYDLRDAMTLNGKNAAMLSSAEVEMLEHFVMQGRKWGVLIAVVHEQTNAIVERLQSSSDVTKYVRPHIRGNYLLSVELHLGSRT
ncbi:hypothetical protein [Methylovirgula sp. 4M-Z18]|uniref:hypothetical protein n=1 Tax=Methylovirgula sp. 4M-Z18 TaxID=2293567 RepID=UPI000E2F6512|nr:hypothetical protein [Methylovirgula sp. 4M-Z18]RFB76627.1 hypothetical protein DYH55_19365 [Methylovirgula sp. 4M-Z18]